MIPAKLLVPLCVLLRGVPRCYSMSPLPQTSTRSLCEVKLKVLKKLLGEGGYEEGTEIQGPVGPKGDKGLPGPAGDPGLPGQPGVCTCDLDAVNSQLAALQVSAPACSMNVGHDSASNVDGQNSWCGRTEERDSMEIKFDAPRRVAGIVTQGNPQYRFWTTTYHVACLTEEGAYKEYAEHGKNHYFTGNSDMNGKVFNIFSEPMTCQAIRITPRTWHSFPCLRVDLLHEGCYAPTSHKFVVTSKGAHDGWQCSIKVNGIEKKTGGRGFCVVSFDPNTLGYKAAGFDTHGDPAGQSAHMASFLAGLQSNSIVAIAVVDEATRGGKVFDNVKAQLKGLGADEDPSCNISDLGYRDSYAFIGQKVHARSDRPDWVSCQHVKARAGYAVVKATITTKRRFVIP